MMGTAQTFSQQGTGCMSCRRAASVVAALTPILRLVAITVCLNIELAVALMLGQLNVYYIIIHQNSLDMYINYLLYCKDSYLFRPTQNIALGNAILIKGWNKSRRNFRQIK